MLKLLAFDYGASSGRAILGLFDGERLILEEVHRFSNDPVMVNETLYWDVLKLFYEMKTGILKCIQRGDRDISGIRTPGCRRRTAGKSGALQGCAHGKHD